MNIARFNIRCSRTVKAQLIEYAAADGLPLVDYLLKTATQSARATPRTKTRSIVAESEDQKRPSINIRCSQTTLDKISDAAEKYSLTISAYVLKRGLRQRLRKPYQRKKEETLINSDTLSVLSDLGATLNEQARAMHSGQSYSLDAIERVCDGIRAAFVRDDYLKGLLRAAYRDEMLVAPFSASVYVVFLRLSNNLNQLDAALGSQIVRDASDALNRLLRANANSMTREAVSRAS